MDSTSSHHGVNSTSPYKNDKALFWNVWSKGFSVESTFWSGFSCRVLLKGDWQNWESGKSKSSLPNAWMLQCRISTSSSRILERAQFSPKRSWSQMVDTSCPIFIHSSAQFLGQVPPFLHYDPSLAKSRSRRVVPAHQCHWVFLLKCPTLSYFFVCQPLCWW